MLNMICITAAELSDKAKEAGIVVLIGVVMVFVILGLLIGVVKILKYVNAWLNSWDSHMVIVRERKSEIKKMKVAMNDHFSHEKSAILNAKDSGSMTEQQASEALAKLTQEKNEAKAQFKVDKIQTNIRYDTVFNVINEGNYRIKKLIKAEKSNYKAALKAISGENKKKDIEALKTERILKKVELDKNIKFEEKERDARVALAKAGLPVPANESHGAKELSNVEVVEYEVNDGNVIAAITAAITMIMSEESIAKKAGFKVRSIKLVK